jgi:hypothetical protein
LPQHVAVGFLVIEAGELFCPLDESATIRAVLLPLHEEMNMIRHEAVRNKREVFVDRRAQDLSQHQVDTFAAHEHVTSLIRAEGQEIPIAPEIVERLEMFWFAGEHEADTASTIPLRSG